MAYQVAVGSNTTFYVGKKAASGTANYFTAWSSLACTEIISFSFEPVITNIPDPSMYSGISTRAYYSGGVSWQGKLKIRANYQGTALSVLLGGLLGSNTTGTVVESSTQAYLEFLFLRGGMETTPLYERLSDVCITGMTFKCAAGSGAEAMGTFEFDFIASLYTSGLASLTGSAPAAPTVSPVLFHQATVASWCDGLRAATSPFAYRPKSVEITYRVPLDPSNFIFGSATALTPQRTGLNTCQWKFEEALMSVTPTVAASTGATNGVNKLCAAFGTTGVSLMFESGSSASAKVAAYSGPIESYGEVREVITWDCGYNSTEGGALKITQDYTP